VSFWMPQEVKALSSLYSNTTVGLLVMIPHLVGLVAMVWISRSSDRTLERKYHAAIPAIVAGIAFVSLGATRSTFLSVALLSCVAAGIYSVYGPLYSLPGEFLTGYSAASGIAVISSVANFGGFVGPYAVGAISTRTGSLYGGLALAGMSLLISATLMLLLPMSGRLGRSERG
jgi:ACS family tartrate transporter-like MFS transporter